MKAKIYYCEKCREVPDIHARISKGQPLPSSITSGSIPYEYAELYYKCPICKEQVYKSFETEVEIPKPHIE